ncbi:hypothetical protein ACOMHN_044527 [Nucella lapillus]
MNCDGPHFRTDDDLPASPCCSKFDMTWPLFHLLVTETGVRGIVSVHMGLEPDVIGGTSIHKRVLSQMTEDLM